jgi:hypothetical protein
MTVPVPCRIDYTVRHKGDGNNELRVRFGSYWNLIWAKIHDFELDPGKSASRTSDVLSDDTGSDDTKQDVRWRLSRAVLTKAIDWELSYTVNRLKDETDATNECQTTITNDEE